MKRVIQKFIRKTGKSYQRLAVLANGRLFCMLFNAHAAFKRIDVRFYCDNVNGVYKAKSGRFERFFYSKNQNYNSYLMGMKERGLALGRAYFCDKIAFQEGDWVIDCGANVGDLKLYFEVLNLKVNYLGIEPSPKEFECLQRNVAPAKALNIGLWSHESSLDFYVSSQNADSSFIEPQQYTDVVSVPTKRLDTIVNQPIKLLKIEAEGAEPEALVGCTNLLNNIEYISADLGFERGISQESTLAPVTNLLLTNGFELVSVSYPRIVALYKRCTLD